MKKNSLYKQLETELASFKKVFATAVETIRDQDVSAFPIFVLHQNLVDIGINIVDKEKVKGNWSVNASTLEEFVAKQIVSPEKIDDFKLLYKSHDGEFCLFVLSELGADFIFLPK